MPQTFYLNWFILGILFFFFHYIMFVYLFYFYIALMNQGKKNKILRCDWWK
nr:ATP synthase F0 subunit 8 [Megathrips lativentris]